jgi:malate dehydrogenase (quinone)
MNYNKISTDVTIVGTGIMSATLGMFLHKLRPDWSISFFERLDAPALESSDAWNNAGTGHSAFCELNYTYIDKDGNIDCTKAFKVAEQFEVSKQFWAYLVDNHIILDPTTFIHSIPHMSFVKGENDIHELKMRHAALTQNHLFEGMAYIDNPKTLNEFLPLMMEERDFSIHVAATKMDLGTDVNFGSLTRSMMDYLELQDNIHIYYHHEVKDIIRNKDYTWHIQMEDKEKDIDLGINTKFVFIGAGGGALYLLGKSDIPEANGYGGFPVSGQWLRCTNDAIIEKHHAKVYGKAGIGTPPMSVPHLDTRIIDGKQELLFGPFAGFSTKFLKEGSYLDLLYSLELENIIPLIQAGMHNIPLTKYLIEQVSQSFEDKIEALKEYYPNAKAADWKLEIAGQRVQVIKKDPEKGGILEFGTELVHAKDGSLAALLGASPGASTSVSIIIEVLEKCFPNQFESKEWQEKLLDMIPSHGFPLAEDKTLCDFIRNWTSRSLGLDARI